MSNQLEDFVDFSENLNCNVKTIRKIASNFVVFLEYMNFSVVKNSRGSLADH